MGALTSNVYQPGSMKTTPKSRRSAEQIKTSEMQPVLPFTGKDFSEESMQSAVAFNDSHKMPPWHKDARCSDKPQDMFFGSERDESTSQRHRPALTMSEANRAKAVCDRCPVRKPCLEYALMNHEEYGVWGGTTARDRLRWWKENDAEWARRSTDVDLT